MEGCFVVKRVIVAIRGLRSGGLISVIGWHAICLLNRLKGNYQYIIKIEVSIE